MTRKNALKEYENLPLEEKQAYSSFEDYLGANAQCICEGCDEVVEYDEVDEDGHCFSCSEEEPLEEEE